MNKLYLMQAKLDLVKMARWSAEQRFNDVDRSLHCLVYGTFGKENTPKPFIMQPDRAHGTEDGLVLAYTPLDEEELRALARRNQTLAMESVISPESIRTAETPREWKPGTKIRFSTRVRPTMRKKWEETGKSTERDIYIERGEGTTRAQLYCDWTAGMMEKQGGAHPVEDSLAMTQFRIRKVRRQRNSMHSGGPDVTIRGTLEVRDPEGFRELLSRGIGRHRAYGYGMVLLKPVE